VTIKITLTPFEVQNILLIHIQEKFKHHAGEHEYVSASRADKESPPAFEALVTIERRSYDPY
jgi:hypothetical protein